MGLALCLGAAFLPFGCGGDQDFAVVPSNGSFDAPEAPPRTVQEITGCAERSAGRLKDTHYAITFDVDVTPSGETRGVKLRESMIPDHDLESCIEHALANMRVPRHILARASRPRGAVSPQSRAPMGNVVVLVGVAELVPILIVVAGVSIVVGVTIQIVAEEVEAAKRRPTQIERECEKWRDHCFDYPYQPPNRRKQFGLKKDCDACFSECKNSGAWPDYKCPRTGFPRN